MKEPQSKIIFHLITGLEIGGAEMMLTKILPLTQPEFDHHVISIIGDGPIGHRLSEQGIAVHHLDLNHKLDFTIIGKFRRLVKTYQPDILITYLPHADLLGRILGRLTGIPTIVCSIRVKLWQSKYLPLFILDGLTSSLVTHYHFNSPAVARTHCQLLHIPSRRASIIPNAVEITSSPTYVNPVQKKEDLHLPTHYTLIGCVARLRRQKGFPYLIRAMPLILASYPQTHLVLIGDGAERKRLTNLVHRLNLQSHVTFLGNRDDVVDILPLLDIYIQPSLYEGMSNSLMEAMAARRPIITTNIPESKDLLEHNVSALLIPKKDPAAIAVATMDLLNDPQKRARISTQAFHTVSSNYAIKNISQKYREFYARL